MRTLVVLFAVVIFASMNVSATPRTEAQIGAEIWGELMPAEEVKGWVALAEKYSRYEAPEGATLRIDMVPAQMFDLMYCGSVKSCGVLGFYNEKWAPDLVHVRVDGALTTESKQTMLHETVHWLQYVDGYHWPNWQTDCADLEAAEIEAYTAHYVYGVEELGVRGEPFSFYSDWNNCQLRHIFTSIGDVP